MRICLVFLFIFFIQNRIHSQISFEKTYGDSIDFESAHTAKQTYDGGYIVLGTNNKDLGPHYGYPILIKTDSLGNELWRKSVGDFNLYRALATSLKITSDSGFIITGGSWENGEQESQRDVFLLKTDKDGNQEWITKYDSLLINPPFSVHREFGNDVLQADDNGFLVTGEVGGTQLLLLKTDSIGNLQWVTTDTGKYNARGNSLIEVDNNSILVLGDSHDNAINTQQMYLAKFDSTGNKIWGLTYIWSQGSESFGYSLKSNSSGDYFLLGSGVFSLSYADVKMLLIKTDTAGNVVWEYTPSNYYKSWGLGLEISHDDYLILTGIAVDTSTGVHTVCLLKTDTSGLQSWSYVYSGNQGHSIAHTFDNGFIISGVAAGDIYLLKTTDDGLILSGQEIIPIDYSLTAFPNPSDGIVKLNLIASAKNKFNIEVSDLYGKKISSRNDLYSNEEIILDNDMLCNGLNIIKVYSNDIYLYSKIIIIK